MKPFSIPEISALEFGQKLKDNVSLFILDVRELAEISQVRLTDQRVLFAPLSRLAYEGLSALPKELHNRQAEIVVICHHGIRSAEVTAWLLSQGWTNVCSLNGGVDAYAALVDPSIGRYY
jgi:rhodanese-related sulfurtransferase